MKTSRINNTAVNVTWDKLTLEEARGFIQAYIVSYDTVDFVGQRKREVRVEEVGPNESHKVLRNLQPREKYYIAVSAQTNPGEGIRSDPTIVIGKSMSLLVYDI